MMMTSSTIMPMMRKVMPKTIGESRASSLCNSSLGGGQFPGVWWVRKPCADVAAAATAGVDNCRNDEFLPRRDHLRPARTTGPDRGAARAQHLGATRPGRRTARPERQRQIDPYALDRGRADHHRGKRQRAGLSRGYPVAAT